MKRTSPHVLKKKIRPPQPHHNSTLSRLPSQHEDCNCSTQVRHGGAACVHRGGRGAAATHSCEGGRQNANRHKPTTTAPNQRWSRGGWRHLHRDGACSPRPAPHHPFHVLGCRWRGGGGCRAGVLHPWLQCACCAPDASLCHLCVSKFAGFLFKNGCSSPNRCPPPRASLPSPLHRRTTSTRATTTTMMFCATPSRGRCSCWRVRTWPRLRP